MKRHTWLACACGIVVLGLAPNEVRAGATAAPAAPARPASPTAVTQHAMHQEIDAALVREQRLLSNLESRRDSARDEESALALERDVANAKKQTELAILAIQADYARRAGNLTAAARIEAVIRSMKGAAKPAESQRESGSDAGRPAHE